jgi:histidinol phosphatase-like PHP family hydrolase
MIEQPVRGIRHLYPQDLHVHSTYSRHDSAVVPEQTLERIASIGHARVLGISDHLESILEIFDLYSRSVRSFDFRLGAEVNGAEWVAEAEALPLEYYIYHCRNRGRDYSGAARLLATGKPLIIAHPTMLGTDLKKVPPACLIEINNRYVWRPGGLEGLRPFRERFRFVIGSDAHQPHWLNQNVARAVAVELGVEEALLFE